MAHPAAQPRLGKEVPTMDRGQRAEPRRLERGDCLWTAHCGQKGALGQEGGWPTESSMRGRSGNGGGVGFNLEPEPAWPFCV